MYVLCTAAVLDNSAPGAGITLLRGLLLVGPFMSSLVSALAFLEFHRFSAGF